MEYGPSSRRLVRRFAVFALPFMLLVAMLSAPSASAGGAPGPGASMVSYQVYICPIDYAGEDYLTDCVAGPDPYEISLFGNGGDIDLIGATDSDGFVTFTGLPLGTSIATLGVPGDFAHFYYACFDTSSGAEIYLYDGTGNQITEKTSGRIGSSFLCRWYVTPESQGGEQPSADPSLVPIPSATAAIQVYICPVGYTGFAYLTDCDPTLHPVGVLLSPSVPFDANDVVAAQTVGDGAIAFVQLDAGDYSVALDIPGEFADFYVACFDAPPGAEEFLFDDDTNTVSFDLAEGSTISCRFYVIPENLSGESASPGTSAVASVAPSVSPSASPRASGGPIGVAVLPSTGTGTGLSIDSNAVPAIALIVLVLIAISAAVLATRRFATSR